MKRHGKRLMAGILTGVMFFGMCISAAAADGASENEEIISSQSELDELIEKRAEFICDDDWEEVDAVDQELEEQGVDFLSDEEVSDIFETAQDANSPSLCVGKPSSSYNTWLSSTDEYTYNGKTYVVQTLTAQPSSSSSNLKQKKTGVTLKTTDKLNIGTAKVVTSTAKLFLGSTAETVKNALSVFDSVKNSISGLSKSTVMTNAEVDYTCAFVETVTFKYVKIKGQSNSKQKLSYISTRGVTKVGYQYAAFSYKGGSAKADVIQGKYTITSTPSGYNNISRAVKAYLSTTAPSRAWISSVKITGISGGKIMNITPLQPEFPSQIN